MKKRFGFHLLRDEQGASLVELAFVLPLFPLLLFGAIDFGRAFYVSVEIVGAAQAAAAYGSQSPTDTTGMQSAALEDAPNVPNLSVSTATYGCECSDGTSYSASCSVKPTCSANTEVQRVNVTVTGTYSPLIPWPGVPSTMSLSSSASMRSGGS
ncbi:MAG: TadE/TadG family type IV pilus assembly protein [Terracidiphilus sp.]|jgi:Flp pilus assembly protein TadG